MNTTSFMAGLLVIPVILFGLWIIALAHIWIVRPFHRVLIHRKSDTDILSDENLSRTSKIFWNIYFRQNDKNQRSYYFYCSDFSKRKIGDKIESYRMWKNFDYVYRLNTSDK